MTRHSRPGWMLGVLGPVVLGVAGGCGTTRITDTLRTGTEQLLISNAIDRSVSELDFQCLAGKSVYFDPQYLEGVVDRGYLISSLRQHLLASGCRLQEERSKATYVVEVRSGGVGTDRHALLVGVPQMNVPTLVPGQPAQIPEIPLAKKTDQQGIAKIAVFAYNRLTGQPVWQSGVVQAVSTSKDTWLLGAGPFQQGTIFKETQFAGQPISFPHFTGKSESESEVAAGVPVTEAASWTEALSGPMALTQPSGLPSLVPAGGLQRIGPTDQLVLDLVGGGAPPTAAQVSPGSVPVASEPPAPTKPPASESKSSAAPAPNSGGQEETQPNKIFSSGFGSSPGTSSDSGASHAASGSGGKKKPPGS